MVTIIGGGPIGCYTASLLAKNHEVSLYEENEEVGIPIQCTGILSETIHELLPLKKEFVANKVRSARIFAPNKKNICIELKKPNVIVYRNKFDQHFRDRAINNGAEIFYSHRFIEKNKVKDLKNKKQKKIKYDTLIGADGPLSKVSKKYGLGKRSYLQGVQALIKKKNDNAVDFYPYIGTYAWAVPQSEDVLRVGVAAPKNAMKIFKEFSKKYKGKNLGWQGGLIPIHDPKIQAQKDNVFLVGDAAAQIKNTTGGGLIPGLMCAEELSKAISENKDYDKLWRKRVGRKLWTHYFARKVMNRFEEKDWNEMVNMFTSKRMRTVLSTESRDEPVKVITKALLRNPKLLLFLRKLF